MSFKKYKKILEKSYLCNTDIILHTKQETFRKDHEPPVLYDTYTLIVKRNNIIIMKIIKYVFLKFLNFFSFSNVKFHNLIQSINNKKYKIAYVLINRYNTYIFPSDFFTSLRCSLLNKFISE